MEGCCAFAAAPFLSAVTESFLPACCYGRVLWCICSMCDPPAEYRHIRLSIGTEHIDDIIADLEKGFAAVK